MYLVSSLITKSTFNQDVFKRSNQNFTRTALDSLRLFDALMSLYRPMHGLTVAQEIFVTRKFI